MPIRKPKFCVIIPVHAPPCYKGSPWFIIISYIWYNDISSSIIYVVCIYMIYHHHIYIFFTYMIYISYHIHHIRGHSADWAAGCDSLCDSLLTKLACRRPFSYTPKNVASVTSRSVSSHTVHVFTMEAPCVQHVTLACIILYMYSLWKHHMCNMSHWRVSHCTCIHNENIICVTCYIQEWLASCVICW